MHKLLDLGDCNIVEVNQANPFAEDASFFGIHYHHTSKVHRGLMSWVKTGRTLRIAADYGRHAPQKDSLAERRMRPGRRRQTTVAQNTNEKEVQSKLERSVSVLPYARTSAHESDSDMEIAEHVSLKLEEPTTKLT
ncbi:hypothetical protein FCULG_00004453 [Fusarium culmorum]|uniref:Uncharacterized protein n=1 Tax=Fusarium culmorum TaxID=5516 RepID=A0A2T4H8C2_FUSCU|nr:hypothetical protein FCULG_00004453 [Fusarium culmorum]